MHIDFPFHFDGRGKTAETSPEDYIRDLIEQVLFTVPGERVNQPEFGSGLLQLVFAPNSSELATATQALVQSALQRWLGDLIAIEGVEVESREETIRVTVKYVIRRTGTSQVAQFSREGARA